jgi:hypothetical protein
MTSRAERLRLYPQRDKMMMEDAPVVPVYHPVYYDIHIIGYALAACHSRPFQLPKRSLYLASSRVAL